MRPFDAEATMQPGARLPRSKTLAVRVHDARDAQDRPVPDVEHHLDPGEMVVVGRDPAHVRERHPTLVAGRRLIYVRTRPTYPGTARISRAQVVIYVDDFGLPRMLNLGRATNVVWRQDFGRRSQPLRPRFGDVARSHGLEVPYACTLWLPPTGPRQHERRISIVNPIGYAISVDDSGRSRSLETYHRASVPWPTPQSKKEQALVELAAPLLRFPAVERDADVRSMNGNPLRSACEELVRDWAAHPRPKLGRNAETVAYLLETGTMTLERLHRMHESEPAGGSLSTALEDAARLHEQLRAGRGGS